MELIGGGYQMTDSIPEIAVRSQFVTNGAVKPHIDDAMRGTSHIDSIRAG